MKEKYYLKLNGNSYLPIAQQCFKNCGNYRAFGDKKFIPELSEEKFWSAIKNCSSYEKYSIVLNDIWTAIKEVIYRDAPPFKLIGFRNENGLSTYYSSNITKEEATKIKDFEEEK